jgi:DNA-binding transcriptional LysR family regulator
MDFRHLQTFRAIVDEGSFAGAAERLQYAQSTVTLQVQQLETELGVELFDRQKKKIQLTKAGHNLLTHARHVLNQMEALQQSMTELVAGETGHIRLGVIEPLASLRMPRVLLNFCEAYPKMHLTLETWGTGITSQKVAEGELDLALTATPRPSLNLVFEPLFVEPLTLLLPLQHPLNQLEKIQLVDLVRHRLLLTHSSCSYRELLERTLLEHGLMKPHLGLVIGSLEALKRSVQQGLGVAIVPVMATNPLPAGTTSHSLDNLDLRVSIGLVHKADLAGGRALDYLVKLLRQEFSTSNPQIQ